MIHQNYQILNCAAEQMYLTAVNNDSNLVSCSMQVDTNWYWNQQPKHHVITVPTRTILHPQVEGDAITDFHAIPTSICYRTQAKKSISRQSICFTDADYDNILEGIG